MNSKIISHPLLDEKVIIASGREKRPFQEKKKHHCPFCVGSEEVPQPIDNVISLPNKFPSLSLDNDYNNDNYEAGKGICEVILYSSDHNQPLYQKGVTFIERVIKHWIKRTRDIREIEDIKYVFLFENYGKEIGVSLEHPHGQLYAFPFIPKVIKDLKRGFSEKGCIYCNSKPFLLTIYETDYTNISVPRFSKWPFELHLFTKRHISKLDGLTDDEIQELSIALEKSFLLLENLFDIKVSYIMSVFQTYLQDKSNDFHFYIELISPQINRDRFKYRAGVETALGIFINSIDPEEQAIKLKKLISQL